MGFGVIILAVAIVVRKNPFPPGCLRNLIRQGSEYDNALYKCGDEQNESDHGVKLVLSTEA